MPRILERQVVGQSLWEDGFRKKFYHNVISVADSAAQPFYVAVITPVIHYCMGGEVSWCAILAVEVPGLGLSVCSWIVCPSTMGRRVRSVSRCGFVSRPQRWSLSRTAPYWAQFLARVPGCHCDDGQRGPVRHSLFAHTGVAVMLDLRLCTTVTATIWTSSAYHTLT